MAPNAQAQHTARELSVCAAPDGYRLAYVWWEGGQPMFDELFAQEPGDSRFETIVEARAAARRLIAAAAKLFGREAV